MLDLIRQLGIVAHASMFEERMGLFDESRLQCRVWPRDLDINLHVNNARYLKLLEEGRVHLLTRIGLMGAAIKQGWQLLLGSSTVRYKFPLEPFQRYDMVSRIVCWDEKWLYLEQRFERNGAVACIAYVKLLALATRPKRRKVTPEEMIERAGTGGISPPMPGGIATWIEAEQQLRDLEKAWLSGEEQPSTPSDEPLRA